MMKMNKLLLIPSATIVAITPSLVCTSCGNNPSPIPDAETIAGYIFDPLDSEETKGTDDWTSTVLSWNDQQWQAEIFYDLFGCFNFENFYSIGNNISFRDLYQKETVGIKTNIAKCEIKRDVSQRTASITFLGYVSFVFIQDYNDDGGQPIYKKNDYVMLTCELKDFPIIIKEVNIKNKTLLGFEYNYNSPTPLPYCVGLFKVRRLDEEFLNYLESIDTTKFDEWHIPTNSQRYVKNP